MPRTEERDLGHGVTELRTYDHDDKLVEVRTVQPPSFPRGANRVARRPGGGVGE